MTNTNMTAQTTSIELHLPDSTKLTQTERRQIKEAGGDLPRMLPSSERRYVTIPLPLAPSENCQRMFEVARVLIERGCEESYKGKVTCVWRHRVNVNFPAWVVVVEATSIFDAFELHVRALGNAIDRGIIKAGDVPKSVQAALKEYSAD